MINVLKGWLYMLLLFVTSTFGVIFMAGPILPIFFINPKLFRLIFDQFLGLWEYNTAVSTIKVAFYFIRQYVLWCDYVNFER